MRLFHREARRPSVESPPTPPRGRPANMASERQVNIADPDQIEPEETDKVGAGQSKKHNHPKPKKTLPQVWPNRQPCMTPRATQLPTTEPPNTKKTTTPEKQKEDKRYPPYKQRGTRPITKQTADISVRQEHKSTPRAGYPATPPCPRIPPRWPDRPRRRLHRRRHPHPPSVPKPRDRAHQPVEPPKLGKKEK